MDALIELSDEDADWKLNFQEFLKCLNPSFNPPEKSMPKPETECWWRREGYRERAARTNWYPR